MPANYLGCGLPQVQRYTATMGRPPLLVLALAIAAASVRGQDARRQLPPAETKTVFVDVVVRDGKGRPVTDLTAADFEVRENGVPQTLE